MSELLKNLNTEQQKAVCHTSGPLLIVAGAGTGKTTVITRKIAYLIEQKLCRPDEILALTFTEKAATEMEERADLLLPLGNYDAWISTFHSFCERVLKNHALDIGISNDFKLLEDVAQWVFVYNNFEKFNLNYYRPLGNPNKFIDALLTHFSRCKDELISPQSYLDYSQGLKLSKDQPTKTKKNQPALPVIDSEAQTRGAGRELRIKNLEAASKLEGDGGENKADEMEIARTEEVAEAYHVYQKLLLDNNYLDFGDLINYTLELFQKRPKILEYYRNRFKFILVDEFQDTNFAQYQLVKLLANKEQNLTVVGDDDQSIYKFRGASVSNILKFKEDFPKAQEITLTENYRSGQEILDLAYNLIQANNPDRLEVKLKINKKLKTNLKDKATIEVLQGEDLSSELNLVTKKILEIKNSKNSQNATWNDFAVLMRTNSAADELLPVLSASNIPHTFVASTGLYKKPIILDLISYFLLLDNFQDSFSLYRVLNFPLFKFSAHDLSKLLEKTKKNTLSLYESIKLAQSLPGVSKETIEKTQKLLAMLNQHADLAKKHSAAESAVQIIMDLEIKKRLEEETLENAENRELIEQFYQKIEKFEQEHFDKSLHNFLYLLNLEQQAGDMGKIKFDPNLGPESLKVMTVHSAKGLEFKHVFIINLVDQRFPTRQRLDAIEIPKSLIKDILPEGDFHLQEERRLFYVAITRAKTNLFLSWGKNYGGNKLKKPSIFLQETGLVPSDKVSLATGKVIFTKPLQKPVIFQDLPNTFSYSKLNDFETCPLKYKYQYYLKLPVGGNHYLSFGQTMHKVFEDFLKSFQDKANFSQPDLFGKSKKNPELGDLKDLEKLYEKNWVDEWYQSKIEKEKYRSQGNKLLKTFYAQLKENPPHPKYIEKAFFLKLDKYKFTGKIDRADETKEGLQIIDYKTGKIPKKSDKKNLEQLYIYQWAAQEFLKENVAGLTYWYLQDNKFLNENIASESQISELKKHLLELIEKIIHVTKYDLFNEEHKKVRDHNCQFENLE